MKYLEKEINNQHLFGLAIEQDVLFSNHKSVFKSRIQKRQTSLAHKITFLEKFLHEDEKIYCITTGCSPTNLLEQLLMGIWVVYIKRCMLVFTNKRILHIPTKANFAHRNSISQILYTDCRSIKMKGSTLFVNYSNNSKENFNYIAGNERKKIRAFLETVSFDNYQDSIQTRTHLCPNCTEQLIDNEYICPNCQLEFKNKSKCLNTSLIFPGGGYFYTGHMLLGFADAITETLLTIFVIVSLIDAIRGVEDGIALTIIFGISLAIEKIITVYDSNKFLKEFIPSNKNLNIEIKKSQPDPTSTLRLHESTYN